MLGGEGRRAAEGGKENQTGRADRVVGPYARNEEVGGEGVGRFRAGW